MVAILRVNESPMYINRCDSSKRKGYMFRVKTSDGKCHYKMFSDATYGSATGAYEAAEQYKKEYFKDCQRPIACHRRQVRNKLDLVGLTLNVDKSPIDTNVAWVATTMDNGKQRKRFFSIRKYGYVNAYQQARAFRVAYTQVESSVPSDPPKPPKWLELWLDQNNIKYNI